MMTASKQRQDGTAGFEPEVPANERPQTHNLDREVVVIGLLKPT
jgi:hypothetical protein